MKKENEEILKKWGDLGFLYGLKSGSQNEWRCAKSFDLMANFLLNNSEKYKNFNIIAFPLIRKIICTGKKRINRIVDPCEIFDCLGKITLGECFAEVENKKMNGEKKIIFTSIKNFCIYKKLFDKNIIELVDIIYSTDPEDELSKDFNFLCTMLEKKIDCLGEIICFVSETLKKYINNKKEGDF